MAPLRLEKRLPRFERGRYAVRGVIGTRPFMVVVAMTGGGQTLVCYREERSDVAIVLQFRVVPQ